MKTTLGEIAVKNGIQTGPFGSQLHASDYVEAGVGVVMPQDLRENVVSLDEIAYVSSATADSLRRHQLCVGDIVYSRRGDITRRALIRGDGPELLCGTGCLRVRIDKNTADPAFVSYFLGLPTTHEWLYQHAVGATMPNLNTAILSAVPVYLPDLGTQRAIGEVLGALDDKIAANRHLIEIIGQYCLATIARSLSVSATVESLGSICEFHNRRRVPLSKAERESRVGEVPYYGATSRMGYVNEPLFDQQLVLVGEDGSVVDEFGHPIVQYIWGPAWVNNHAHVLTGTIVSTEMLRWLLRRCNVESLITGAVQPKLSMGQLKSLRVDLPSGTELDQAEAIISTLSAQERAVAAEIECRARTRDELLPLLMSGQVTVKDAERAAEPML